VITIPGVTSARPAPRRSARAQLPDRHLPAGIRPLNACTAAGPAAGPACLPRLHADGVILTLAAADGAQTTQDDLPGNAAPGRRAVPPEAVTAAQAATRPAGRAASAARTRHTEPSLAHLAADTGHVRPAALPAPTSTMRPATQPAT
jgi:hypothetical protein